jgi:transcription elongation factor GreA
MGKATQRFEKGIVCGVDMFHESLAQRKVRSLSCQKAMTEEIVKKLKDEIKVLEEELHVELPRALKVAREHGDLSENADYDAAKERQGFVNARLGQLKHRLAELSMVNFDNIPEGKVSFGSQVTLYDLEKENEVVYKLVMSEDADASKGLISTTSPIGRALMGKEEGDEVDVDTPGGRKSFEITKLITIHDAT